MSEEGKANHRLSLVVLFPPRSFLPSPPTFTISSFPFHLSLATTAATCLLFAITLAFLTAPTLSLPHSILSTTILDHTEGCRGTSEKNSSPPRHDDHQEAIRLHIPQSYHNSVCPSSSLPKHLWSPLSSSSTFLTPAVRCLRRPNS